eukprot:TRINITY_DN11703_c0_g1_i10.p1 TRINITY_DN11703_c0_g1~~TRINITY_DN11703_c0_g1_i10.p1  ORF type:complete len:209 (+),score=53.11 TRINITY_DN11703_c0_g1_i10:156-782(+)
MLRSLVGSEMCIRDRYGELLRGRMGNKSGAMQPQSFGALEADMQRATELGGMYDTIQPWRFECDCTPCVRLKPRWKQHVVCWLVRPLEESGTRTKISIKQFYDILAVLEQAQSSSLSVSQIMRSLSDSDSAERECCLCMNNLSNVSLACSHSFCQDCLDNWLQREETCPMCREQSTESESYVMITDEELAMQHADYVHTLTTMLAALK